MYFKRAAGEQTVNIYWGSGWVRNKTLRERELSHADLYITSDFIYHMKRADWQEQWGETDKTMVEEFQNKI